MAGENSRYHRFSPPPGKSSRNVRTLRSTAGGASLENEGRIEKLRRLSKREREVLELLCQRHTYKEIGGVLYIEERTVQFHVRNICDKLGILDLPRGPRQRELGVYCPLVEIVEPEELAQEPDPPPDAPIEQRDLVRVLEIEPLEEITVGLQTYEDVPPEPPRRGRRLLLLVVLLLLAGVAGAVGARMFLPPPVQVVVQPAATAAATPSPRSGSTVSPGAAASTPGPPTPTPNRTPSVTPTPTAIPRTRDGSILRFGETWAGDGLYVTAKNAPEGGGFNSTVVHFSVENRTGQTLNFGVLGTAFSLETNTNKFYAGRDSRLAFNDFPTSTKRDFEVSFNVPWSTLQEVKLDRQVNWLRVTMKDFNSRLTLAQWQGVVIH